MKVYELLEKLKDAKALDDVFIIRYEGEKEKMIWYKISDINNEDNTVISLDIEKED